MAQANGISNAAAAPLHTHTAVEGASQVLTQVDDPPPPSAHPHRRLLPRPRKGQRVLPKAALALRSTHTTV